MSNISPINDVVPFVSGKSVPLSGQRLSKVVFKTPRKGTEEKKASVCVSVPFILDAEIVDNMNALMPHIAEMLYGVQDQIVREQVCQGATSIHNDSISLKKCIEFLEAESKGDRLTKEVIEQWFMDDVRDMLIVAVGDKMGISDTPTSEQITRLVHMVTAYKDSFSALAGGKTFYDEKKVSSLKRAMEFASDTTSAVYMKLMSRLDKMLEVKKEVDLMAL